MAWNPGVPLRRNEKSYLLGGTEAERATSGGNCSLRTSFVMRPGVRPDTGAWHLRQDNFVLDPFVQAVMRVHYKSESGMPLWHAVIFAQTEMIAEHPSVRCFFQSALERYFEHHEAREEQVGKLSFLHSRPIVNRSATVSLSTSAQEQEQSAARAKRKAEQREGERLRQAAASSVEGSAG